MSLGVKVSFLGCFACLGVISRRGSRRGSRFNARRGCGVVSSSGSTSGPRGPGGSPGCDGAEGSAGPAAGGAAYADLGDAVDTTRAASERARTRVAVTAKAVQLRLRRVNQNLLLLRAAPEERQPPTRGPNGSGRGGSGSDLRGVPGHGKKTTARHGPPKQMSEVWRGSWEERWATSPGGRRWPGVTRSQTGSPVGQRILRAEHEGPGRRIRFDVTLSDRATPLRSCGPFALAVRTGWYSRSG
jgi:hypothetical protein